MRNRHVLGMIGATVVLSLAASASADVPTQVDQPISRAAQVITVADGNRGRMDGEMRLRYPGFEQTTVEAVGNHFVMVSMEAVQEPNKAPVQCTCFSYELQKDAAPKLVAQKRLTDYGRMGTAERTCNHPKMVAAGENIVWSYGSDYNNNRPNTYVGVITKTCDQLAAPIMVNIPRDANDGAPDIVYNGKVNGNDFFTLGYYSDGGDGPGFPQPGGDYSVAMGLELTQDGLLPKLERKWIMPIVTPTNIGRPTLAAAGADRTLFCAPKGPNRPSDHIECALLDTATGNSVWKSVVATGDRQKRIYFNQPTVARLSDNRFALMAIESNGQGKMTNNVKGSNVSHLFMMERNGDSFTLGGDARGAAAHQTHASICTGAYGETEEPSVAVFSAAPTGIGRAAMLMVGYNQAERSWKWDDRADLWPTAWYGDSGHLANWYGRNPMRQGRDYMRCIGGVANPGYHVEKGFMSDVKTFFVGPVHGRVPGEAKNSLFLSLVPGQVDKKALPENPVPAGEAPALDPNAGTTPNSTPESSGGCGCTTPGRTSMPGGLGLAAAAALGLMVWSRRRRG